MSRRFEFVSGSSAKFWEVTVACRAVVVRYGRIGAVGQTLNKSFSAGVAAQSHADKLIAEKLAKGYVECAPAG